MRNVHSNIEELLKSLKPTEVGNSLFSDTEKTQINISNDSCIQGTTLDNTPQILTNLTGKSESQTNNISSKMKQCPSMPPKP